jgi:hypothetical protein
MDSEVMKIQDKLVFPPNVPVSIQIIEIFENLFKKNIDIFNSGQRKIYQFFC